MPDATTQELLTERIITPMSKRLVRLVATYRLESKIESRSAAIRRLIERGLEAEGKKGKAK